MSATINRIELSKSSVEIRKGDTASLTVTVFTEDDVMDVAGIGWINEDNDVVTVYTTLRAVGGADANRTIVTVKSRSAGSSSIRFYAKADPSKFAVLNVNVISDSAEDYGDDPVEVPYTILLNPAEITVQKNQLFFVRARGIGGKFKNNVVDYRFSYRSMWEFVSGSGSGPEFISKENDKCGSGAWFRAKSSGTYQIRVYNPTYPEFGTAAFTVHVTEDVCPYDEVKLHVHRKDIEFLPTKLSLIEQAYFQQTPANQSVHTQVGDEFPVQLPDQASDVGWIVPSNNVIGNIYAKTECIYVPRGDDYGIVPVLFYWKSNPYIYYPVWVECNGGPYEKYINQVAPEPSEVIEIELSETVKVIQKGATAQNVLAWARNSYGQAVGSINITQLSGTTVAGITVLSAPSYQGKHFISISASETAAEGVIYVRVYCEEKPSVSSLLTIYVVDDIDSFLVPKPVSVEGIVLDRTMLNIGIGARAKLNCIVSPDNAAVKDVVWSSIDSSIATVDEDGNVYGVSNGTTTVTVMTVDGGYTDTCVVSIGSYTPVKGITASPSSLVLSIGDTAKISTIISPSNATNKTVNWVSQESYIASVDQNGNVTAVGSGITSIILTTEDGNYTVSVPVTVLNEGQTDPDVNPSNRVVSVDLSNPSLRLQRGDTRTLLATVSYADESRTSSNSKVLWYSSNPAIASVTSDGIVTAITVGTAIITARAVDNNSIFAYCTVTVSNSGTSGGSGEGTDSKTVDYIYRLDYNDDGSFTTDLLYADNLGFDLAHPIESVVYYETEDIQKIYWVDGKNPLRFMNFMAKPDSDERLHWSDGTYFDSNRAVDFGIEVEVSKDNSGNTRPNGVIQYLLTYYNKHGQESGYVWISDLIYLSPVSSGGAADGTNSNSVTLKISKLDTRFTHFRVYSIFRSSLNGTAVANIVFEGETNGQSAVVVDNNSHLTSVDASRLLYLGSQEVIASTLTHKDQTLFLGDLCSVDRDYNDVEQLLKSAMVSNNGWESNYIKFEYDTDIIPSDSTSDSYSYESQLVYSSSKITSFKGGEKYRFAIVFHKKDGTMTDAFWIGDKINPKYPKMTDDGIQRIIAQCTLPPEVVYMMQDKGYKTAQLMIAEATYADRSVKAQGIVCPTVFNVWNRYQNRLYSASSWMMRPRNSEYAWKHFDCIHKSTSSTGEIDCNYWENSFHRPYYRLDDYSSSPKYVETFDGIGGYTNAMLIYRVKRHRDVGTFEINRYSAGVTVVLAKPVSGPFDPEYIFQDGDSDNVIGFVTECVKNNIADTIYVSPSGCEYRVTNFSSLYGSGYGNDSKTDAWADMLAVLRNEYPFFTDELVSKDTFYNWCSQTSVKNQWYFFNNAMSGKVYYSGDQSTVANLEAAIKSAFNDSTSGLAARWYTLNEEAVSSSDANYEPSYYNKHLTFIDENVVTLNSPELEYGAVSFDNTENLRFRIVGVAEISGNYSDYTVYASPGKLSGENLVKESLTKPLIAWPLWKEFGLTERVNEEDAATETKHPVEPDKRDRDSYDYIWGGNFVKYWLRMWNHSGKISGYTDYQNDSYSELHNKVFANARFANKTYYNDYNSTGDFKWDVLPDAVRIFNYTSSQYVGLNIGSEDGVKESRYYDAIINESLSMPGNLKYPVLYSTGVSDPTKKITDNENVYLYLADPVSITYSSTPHAVISLPTVEEPIESKTYYKQTILPRWNFHNEDYIKELVSFPTSNSTRTGCLLPWIDNKITASYPFKDYSVKQDEFEVSNAPINTKSQYLYIGELYSDYPVNDQIRYGGTSDAAIHNCRFVIAGPQYPVASMLANGRDMLIANQGDTYVQKWDCLKTKPFSSDCINNVIDITTVTLETHINIDGRTDLQRGTSYIASIDTEKWGSLNPVYSQKNNFITQHDLDEDFNLDSYRSSITWTLEKHDAADIDEWSHITLASTLKLDGDKGICRALRRLQNSIIAFQDKGISEILFNSRTQLSTTEGVPIEIANSGKVDGKRYLTNKYGCTNKWSIVEGKNALYFVDNLNKSFCAFNGNNIDDLSNRLGFGAWFREINMLEPWNPGEFNNIVSYYDKVHSDIYLVRDTYDRMPCLVYNESLNVFTSFFD